MNFDPRKAVNKIAILLLLVPAVSLLMNAIAWLRFGIDLPFVDDWRVYRMRHAGSFDPSFLFTPANDTLYVTGKVLDAIAQISLDGNIIAYQLISLLTVLGCLLLLQWKLLVLALRDKILSAGAFVWTVFMVQPGSYWGIQAIAYHQALPLLCLLSILWIVLRPPRAVSVAVPLVAVLALLGGLSYISGAVVLSLAGLSVLVLSYGIVRAERLPVISGGLAAIGGSFPTLLAQLWVITSYQHGLHRADATWSLPIDRDFWLYILGKIARSLGLNSMSPLVSFSLTLVAVALVLLLASCFAYRLAKGAPRSLAEARLSVIYLVLTVSIAAYLVIVAAGRTNLAKPTDQSFIAVFQFGYARFHYFWVTIIWPWVVAGLITLANEKLNHRQALLCLLASPAIAISLGIWSGAFDHATYYRLIASHRSDHDVACVRYALAGDLRMRCLDGNPQFDFMPAYLYARDIGSSFTRTFPLLPVKLGSPFPPPLFRLTSASPLQWSTNIEKISQTDAGWSIGSVRDPQIRFQVENDRDVLRCRELEVAVLIKPTVRDVAQLYYRLPGENQFSEKSSLAREVSLRKDSYFTEIFFQASSPRGFLNDFRLDPGRGGHATMVNDLELRCRYQNGS